MKAILHCGWIAAIIYLGGCSRPCPAYPGDVAGVLPVEEQGRVLVYSNGDQEVGLYCGTADYTGKYSIRTNCKCACDVTATMALESDTAGFRSCLKFLTILKRMDFEGRFQDFVCPSGAIPGLG